MLKLAGDEYMTVNRMVYFIIIFVFLSCFSIQSNFALTNNNDGMDDFEFILNNIQNKVKCSKKAALQLFRIINFFAEGIQTEISYIASSKDDMFIKEEKINFVIGRYFENKYSNVQVSSHNKKYVGNYPIHTYLHRIARLNRYKYTKVELLFKPDYLGIGSFEKINDTKYELSISMWQIFQGWIGDNLRYSDATKKKFRLNFNIVGKKVTVAINEILVSETLNLDYFKNKIHLE